MTNPGPNATSFEALLGALLLRDGPRVRAALSQFEVLIAADLGPDGSATVRSAVGEGCETFLWGFTDREALGAWDRAPASAAATMAGEDLLAACDAGRLTVVLNAAGPGATVICAPPANVDPDATQRSGPLVDDALAVHPLADPGRRAALRRRCHRGYVDSVAATQRGDTHAAIRCLQSSLQDCERIGDQLHAAGIARRLAQCLARGGAPERARAIADAAVLTLEQIGEEELAEATRSDRLLIGSPR